MKYWVDSDKRDFKWMEFTKEICGGENIAPVSGMVFPGKVELSINSCIYLEDIYIKQNSAHTKPEVLRQVFSKAAPHSIVVQDTDHVDYAAKRKILAASFSKSKLIALTQ